MPPAQVPDVLVLTADDALAEQVALVAASVGARCRTSADPASAEAPAAALVVVGADRLDRWSGSPGDLVAALDDHRGALPPELVAHRLPSGRAALARSLADGARRGPRGVVVGVVGAVGGAGASTLALALAARGSGWLVDADPVRSGTEAATGTEHVAGARWPDLLGLDGRLPPGSLGGRLPLADGVPVLGWSALDDAVPRPWPTATALEPVLAAARCDVPVAAVDLPGARAARAGPVWRLLDRAVLVVPDAVPAAVAARRLVGGLRAAVGEVHVVVRERRGGPGAAAVAEVLGADDVVRWRAHPALSRAADDGDLVAAVRRGGTAAVAGLLLRRLGVAR